MDKVTNIFDSSIDGQFVVEEIDGDDPLALQNPTMKPPSDLKQWKSFTGQSFGVD